MRSQSGRLPDHVRRGFEPSHRGTRAGQGERVTIVDLRHGSAEEVLAWTYKRFRRVALVASFQAESMVLIDMACRIVPEPEVLTLDTGRLHEETHDYIERGAAALSDPAAHPGAGRGRAGRDDRGARDHAVPPLGRASQRVLRGSQGEPAGAGAARLRRLDHGAAPRADPDPRGDPGCRRRPGPRRHHQGGAAGRMVAGAGVGLPRRPAASTITRCTTAATRRSAALRARGRPQPGENERAGRWWWEGDSDKECLLHPPLEGGAQMSLRGSPVSVPLGAARSTSRP